MVRRRTYLEVLAAGVVCAGVGASRREPSFPSHRYTTTPEQLLEAEFTGEDTDDDDKFGHAVAVDGDTAIVGAKSDEDPNGRTSGRVPKGSAYVFTRQGSEWSQQAKLAPDTMGDDESSFGRQVAVDGGTALVSSEFRITQDPNKTYVYTRSDGDWTHQATLSPGTNGGFGNGLALRGDTALVGASGYDTDNELPTGAVYVFERSDGTWSRTTRVRPPDGDVDDFGFTLTLGGDGDTVLVGAPAVTQATPGVLYEMSLSDGDLTAEARLTGPGEGGHFGWGAAIEGDRMVVGAPRVDESQYLRDRGQAHVYERTSSGWTEQTILEPPVYDEGQQFGYTVEMHEDTLLILGGDRVWVYDWTGDEWAVRNDRGLTLDDSDWEGAMSMVGQRVLLGAKRDYGTESVYAVHVNPSADLAVEDQTVASGATTLTVDSATANVDFYLEVQDSEGATLATTDRFVADSDQTDLQVSLDGELTEDTSVTVVMYAPMNDRQLTTDDASVTVEAASTTAATTGAPDESTTEAADDGTEMADDEETEMADGDGTEMADDDGTEGDDESADGGGSPGFGPASAVTALGSAGYLLKRRLGADDEE